MKKFSVKHYFQENDGTCGIATARMLLDYFGIEITEKELIKEGFIHKSGTWYSDLAKFFLERGLKTKVYTINLQLYSPFWRGKTSEEIKRLLIDRKSKLKGMLLIEANHVIDYIDMGGEIDIDIPRPVMLQKLIKKQPFFIPISRSFIYNDLIDELGHYIVVNGFDGKNYSIIDPASHLLKSSTNGKEYLVDKDSLEYAWLANNRDSDGYLMEILGKEDD